MKNRRLLIRLTSISIILLVIPCFALAQTWTENFNSSSGYSLQQGSEGSGGASDYFMRTDGSDIEISYTGNSGSFFAAQDIDDDGWSGSANPSQLLWTGIDISGKSGLEFSGEFASAATSSIDKSDSVLVEYRLDGGSWKKLLAFRNDGSTYNNEFGEDSNFDGIKDGTDLTSNFTSFTKNIYDSGNKLDLRITIAVNSGGEDFAFDSFALTAVTGNQPPQISNIVQSPSTGIMSSDDVKVSADVSDDGSIGLAQLNWGTSSGNLGNTISMSPETGKTYSTDNNIPSQDDGTKVFYEIYTEDDEGASTTSSEFSYEVKDIEIPDLIISEVTDPADDYEGRFVELYNCGTKTIDFDETEVYFSRQSNGGNHSSKRLTGKLRPGCAYVVANSSNLLTYYGINAELDFGSVTGNGDDGYFLYVNGDENTGVLFDAYGVTDQDGSGEDWEYTDSRAVRKSSVNAPADTWSAGEWTIDSAGTAEMTPAAYADFTTFSGNSGLSWHNHKNWTGGVVPSGTSIVSIPGDKNINVESSGECQDLILESGESGTASMIGATNLTINGEAVVKQFLAETSQPHNWHYLAIPVSNENAEVFPGVSHNNSTIYASTWSEANDQWSNLSGNEALDMLKGYAVPAEKSEKVEFSGNLVTGTQTTSSLSYTAENTYAGFHLVGNPFTAALDASQVSGTNWTEDIWVRTDGDFKEYNVSAGTGTLDDGIIPAMQGFWVRVNSGGGTVTLDPSALTHNATNLYKSTGNHILKLKITRMDYSDEIVLFMDEQAENGFDEEFDTKKMFTDNKLYPQVYFITDKKELAIQGIKPLEDEEKFIPLGVQTNKPGLFEISAENPEVFDPTLEVYLKDKTNEKIINLRMDSYRFKAGSSASITDRFSLILSKGNYTSVNKTNSAGMKVWFYKKRLYIQSARTGEVDLKITDITGRIVQNKRIALQRGTNSVPLNEKTGIYLVYIKINNEIHTRKILLK